MTNVATHAWGRIDESGNVFVRTADGERQIGQWQAGTPEEGLAMYARRFDGLATEVQLLEKRLEGGSVSPDDAAKAVDKARSQITDAQALGDLDSLNTRLDALMPAIEKAREARKVERAAKTAEAQVDKERIIAEAEEIASSEDWKRGVDRLRDLLDQWKALPRLSKSADDALWHRFSSARSSFTRRRKAHFGEQAVARDGARKIKESLIADAEALSSSTEWGPTAGKYRDLMTQWKKAGSAPRNVEDKLWKRFRGAQDVFFNARDAANAEIDAEYAVNADKKLEILADAEKLLPITNAEAARKAWHDIADRWEAAGKVPRGRINELEGRIRTIETAVREAGEKQWKSTDPEKSARADDMIGKLQRALDETRDKLAKAESNGDAKKIKDLQADIASKEAFLQMAQKAQSDFS
ncbi:DUF349 domain-containing protein [Aeromicrobium sp. CF3.5]|uniref:DUF349 domain-containing protein n=1 Tax=Aeromicrobium sp. CF3.5 TaxID=3373078 RepID=UPI003EE4EB46